MRPPPLKAEDIEPCDAKMSTADVKRVYGLFMLKTKFLAPDEISQHTKYFAEELRSHEAFLKEELAQATEDFAPGISCAKEDIRDLRRDLRNATDPEARSDLQSELEAAESGLIEESHFVKKAEEEYRAFRKDKRSFLVAYVNHQTQRRE